MKSYLRFLSRNKLYTAIEIVGLSLALAFVIVLSSYIVNDMSVNKVLKNTDDVYMVHGLERSDCFSEVPGLYETMPEIKSSCGMVHSGRNASLFDDLTTVSYADIKMNAKILGTSDTFFDFFTFPLLEGDPGNALSSKNMLKLLTGFSLICILMTIMTIVGFSSYHAKTGEKDNAVRNVFGCSRKEMIRKITLDFTLPVVISAVVGIPIAYTIIGRWLEGYVIRTDNSPLIYIGAFAVVLAVTIAAVFLQALRLMRTNPAEALKKE